MTEPKVGSVTETFKVHVVLQADVAVTVAGAVPIVIVFVEICVLGSVGELGSETESDHNTWCPVAPSVAVNDTTVPGV